MATTAQAELSQASSPAFEEILNRLSTVVERLESGDMTLEDSLALFEEGVRLSRLGAVRLDEAERRVERLLSEDGHTAMIATGSGSAGSGAQPSNKENEAP
jgi:exodeoxyribonuclease VII small subunit